MTVPASKSSPRRRYFDALITTTTGTDVEGLIARYAAEVGLDPEDPVWETTAPMLILAVQARLAIGDLRDMPGEVVPAMTAGAKAGVTDPAFLAAVSTGVEKAATAAAGPAIKAAAVRADWMLLVFAFALGLALCAGIAFAAYHTGNNAGVAAGYSQGYAAAQRQHPHK